MSIGKINDPREAETLLQRSHRDSGKQLGEQHPVTLSLGKAQCDTVRHCKMWVPGLLWMCFGLVSSSWQLYAIVKHFDTFVEKKLQAITTLQMGHCGT